MTRTPLRHRSSPRTAFTLVEVLVATGILAIILLVILGIINATGKAWNGAVARSESFQEARAAFEALTRALGGATLNTYYKVSYNGASPTSYERASDLQFVSGSAAATGIAGQVGHGVFFQAPLGYASGTTYAQLGGLLNVCGFYVDYSRDALRPAFLDTVLGAASNPYRFRLHQVVQSADLFTVYNNPTGTAWIADAGTSSRQFAANIVAFVLVPEDPALRPPGSTLPDSTSILTTTYDYDSRTFPTAAYLNQLPPVVEVFMAAIDELSAKKICTSATAPALGQGTLFQDPSKLEADIKSLDAILSATPGNAAGNHIPLTHRFFRSKVIIQGAKWSS